MEGLSLDDIMIESKPKKLFGLVDTSQGKEGLAILLVAPIEEVTLWGQLFKLQGKANKRMNLLKLEQLQYLYWNTTQTAPANVKNTPEAELLEVVQGQCEALLGRLTVDTTSTEELRERIALLKPKTGSEIIELEESTMTTKKKTSKKAVSKKATKSKSEYKDGDVLTGRYSGKDYQVKVVETESGLKFKWKGKTFDSKGAAGRAVFAELGLPANRSLKLNLAAPAGKSA